MHNKQYWTQKDSPIIPCSLQQLLTCNTYRLDELPPAPVFNEKLQEDISSLDGTFFAAINQHLWHKYKLGENSVKSFQRKYRKTMKINETNTSRKLSHWTNTIIDKKIKRYCEEHKVCVKLQDSTYRSQRCSQCGLVRKANRKGKVYSCNHCSYIDDADYNASRNHVVNLPEISITLRLKKLNRIGFFWQETGLFTLDGKEFTVPCTN